MSKKIKNGEWNCESDGKAILCESDRGNGVSMFQDGNVRFTKFDCAKPVKVNGKVIKRGKEELCGVELD